jgi:hypothetical protein
MWPTCDDICHRPERYTFVLVGQAGTRNGKHVPDGGTDGAGDVAPVTNVISN